MRHENELVRNKSLRDQYSEDVHLSEIQEAIDSLLADVPSPRVLEAGCGSASRLQFKSNSTVVGIDISQKQLDRNKLISKQILGNIETYDLSGYNFDEIVCRFVLEHLNRPELALDNFIRGLASNGIIIIESPNLLSFDGFITKFTPFCFHVLAYRVLFRIKLPVTEDKGPFPTPFKMFLSPSKVKRFAEHNGLKVEFFRAYQSYPAWKLCKQSRCVRMLLRILQALCKLLTLGKLDIFRGTYTLIMRRKASIPS